MALSSLRRRVVALVSVVALGAGATVAIAAAPAAQAAPQTISASTLDWGFKSSFKSYVSTFGGTITASNGATKTSSGFTWTGAGGSYDPSTKVGTLDYSGKVVYSVPAHGIWNITLSNPTLVLDGDSTGTLLVDVSYATGGTQAAPENTGDQADVVFGDVTVGAPTVSGDTSTYTNQAVTLTAAGSEAFDGFYAPGTALDALTASATVSSTTTPPTTNPPTTNPPTTNPPATNPLTALVNSLVAGLTALLNSLAGR